MAIELTAAEIRRRLHSLFFLMGATMTETQLRLTIETATADVDLDHGGPASGRAWRMVDLVLKTGGEA